MANKYYSDDDEEIRKLVLSNDFDLEEKVKTQDELLWQGEFSWGFAGADLSKYDLSNVPLKKLYRLPFSTETIWPSKSKMQKGFNPKQLLEEALTFKGSGIEELHKKGITGKGVTIVNIDSPFDLNHEEIKGSNIEYVDFAYGEESHFHGITTSSYLVGKNLGVAPGAKLLHYATDSENDKDMWGSLVESELRALQDIEKKTF